MVSSAIQYYTFAMGKLNPAKMANFMEVDVYVLVACPENSLVESQVSVSQPATFHTVETKQKQQIFTTYHNT